MEHEKPRRTYIRRKKALNESIKLIQNTLLKISLLSQQKMSDREVLSQAASFANSIEAQCWSPRLQMSDEEYRNIIMNKTEQICTTLWMKFHSKGSPESQYRSGPSVMQPPPFPPVQQNTFSIPQPISLNLPQFPAPIQQNLHTSNQTNSIFQNNPQIINSQFNSVQNNNNNNNLFSNQSNNFTQTYSAPQKQHSQPSDTSMFYTSNNHSEFPPLIPENNSMPNHTPDEDDVVDMWGPRPLEGREPHIGYQFYK